MLDGNVCAALFVKSEVVCFHPGTPCVHVYRICDGQNCVGVQNLPLFLCLRLTVCLSLFLLACLSAYLFGSVLAPFFLLLPEEVGGGVCLCLPVCLSLPVSPPDIPADGTFRVIADTLVDIVEERRRTGEDPTRRSGALVEHSAVRTVRVLAYRLPGTIADGVETLGEYCTKKGTEMEYLFCLFCEGWVWYIDISNYMTEFSFSAVNILSRKVLPRLPLFRFFCPIFFFGGGGGVGSIYYVSNLTDEPEGKFWYTNR